MDTKTSRLLCFQYGTKSAIGAFEDKNFGTARGTVLPYGTGMSALHLKRIAA